MTDAPKQPTAEELGAALSDKDRVLADAYLATFNKRKAGIAVKYSENSKKYLFRFRRPDVQAYIKARLSEEVMSAEEVLARLSLRASIDGSDFFEQESYEVPVFEPRSIQELIDNAEAKVGRMNAIDPELLKSSIEMEQRRIADWEVQLAMDPDATYQKQVGTRTETRIVPSLKAAERNGVLQFVEGTEYGPNGLKFKWADPVKALELIGKHHKLFTERTEHSGSVDLGVKYIAGLSEDDL
ncbi:terminase small subunit [Deinococcus hopiensis]|uniref:Phage terminase, small subunit n=1 Tax=Deinococcus hopiensis KR-140 TaxID=695939 RepID=A0A1W1VJ80_9DEIO|nr:terminase small subunit [Deinococcus hopiensis]SMB93333.1 Phage terminase, small subunit [Deinococcus hopiensis KR-140]